VAKRKGEVVTLHCAHCRWSTELPMGDTQQSTVVPCAHCAKPLHWHRCEACGLCYLGEPTPRCPSCEEPSLDELEYI